MPSTCRSFTLLSISAGLVAAILAYAFQSQTFLHSSGDESRTYCYDSVTTLSDRPPQANCFSVSAEGTFTDITLKDTVQSTPGVVGSSGHVIPGLWDGHGHLLQFGELLHSVNLFGSQSLKEAASRVEQYLERYPEAGSSTEWIRGTGWDQAAFGRMPTASDLDAHRALRDKYIMLDRVDVHCIWVSNAVLDLLPHPFPAVPGGEVITNPGPGVFCDNAMDMVIEHWPKPNASTKATFVRDAMKKLNRVGLVGIHDAGVTPENIHLYKELADSADWTVRVYAMIECEKRNNFCPESVGKVSREDGLFGVQSVKLFADGALGSWGSAMLEPFSDRPDSVGSLLVNGSVLKSLTHSWTQVGYQVNIHAIGDLANRLAIDAFSNALTALCAEESAEECQARYRFRIEHAQIIHPDDQKRMFDLGIIPSIQPTHATSDMPYAESRLGRKRTLEEAYRMRSFLPLSPVLGSDFPVEPPNPFEGLYAAVARKNPNTGLGPNGTDAGWHVEEALTVEQGLRGFTLGPARAAFMEGKAGIIQEGAFADWVVLDEPLLNASVEGIRTMKVRETWVAGKRVFSR